MKKVSIRQVKSTIKRPKNQVLTLQALGLGRINKSSVKEVSPQIKGMIKKVQHLIEVKEL